MHYQKLIATFKRKSLTLSIATIATAIGFAPPLQAQEDIEEVMVTGSRIRQTSGMTTAVPVTTVSVSELRNFKPEAAISEQLDDLPQFFQTQTGQRGGGTLFGAAAGSYLNLRGMGSARTLVLFDGARVVPSDRLSAVNVDTLPTGLIRSIDVVTGGASAAYGADALAGVVNFVLDREFQGLKTTVSTGINETGDGQNWNFSVAGGTRIGDKLNLIGSMEARNIRQISRDENPDDLDNFDRWGFVTNPAWTPASPFGVPRQLTLPNVHSTIHTPTGLINQPGFKYNRQTFSMDGKSTRPFILGDVVNLGGPGATRSQSGGPEAAIANQAFNGGPFGAEVVQRSGFAGLKYDVSDSLEVFGQIMLGRTESNTYNRRGLPHLQDGSWFATIYRENAFLPEDIRQEMIAQNMTSFRMDKLGQIRGIGTEFNDSRDDENIHQMYSWTVGFDAALSETWNVRAHYQSGEADKITAAYDVLRLDRMFLAMDAVRDPRTGAIVCNVQLYNPTPEQLKASVAGIQVFTESGIREVDSPIGMDNSIRDCQPLNVFGQGNASAEAAEYVVDDKIGRGNLTQDFAEILFNGEIHEGWGPGPVSMAIGATWREQGFWQKAEPAELGRAPLNAPGLGIRGVSVGFLGGSRELHQFTGMYQAEGEFDVWEAFGELNIPIWESGSGQRLDSNIAYRSSDYSTSGRVESWKLGLDVQVIEDLRLRVTKSRDVREATFSERYEVSGGGGNFQDPFQNRTTYEITSINANNPNVAPEVANTVTAGFVYQPSFAQWIDGLQLSLDWYEIDLSQAIGQLSIQRIADECFAGNQSLCALITRNDLGITQRIESPFFNIDAAKTEGVDMEVVYNFEPDFIGSQSESFNIRGLVGYLRENSTTPLSGSSQDLAGTLNRPEYTATLSAFYQVGPYGIRLQERYYDSTILNVNWLEGRDVDDNEIASQTTTNLILSYDGETSAGSTWQASLNVTNLLDRDPPIVPSFGQRGGAQTVSPNFDMFGRKYQLTLNMNF